MREFDESLYGVAGELKNSTADLLGARLAAEKKWVSHVKTVCKAHNSGLSLEQIASLTNVSKSRIWQIVSGRNR